MISRAVLLCLGLALSAAPAAIANPLAGGRLYASPNTSAGRYLARHPDPLIARIAAQPQAVWFDSGSSRADISSYVRAAGSRLPVMVVYNVPGRDCGGYSAGGARSPSAYRAWLRMFAAAVGTRPAVVVLEPDALAELKCLPRGSRGLLAGAVRTLTARRTVALYVDAGNSGWVPAATIAQRLRSVGARHFALNVSNFQTTAASAAYGGRVLAALGDKAGSYVIDTSRNGRGPAPGNPWCNPSGRSVGADPTTSSAIAGVDAFLWIKAPGESDGACNGGPPAGSWWAQYARGLELNVNP